MKKAKNLISILVISAILSGCAKNTTASLETTQAVVCGLGHLPCSLAGGNQHYAAGKLLALQSAGNGFVRLYCVDGCGNDGVRMCAQKFIHRNRLPSL